jgi:hypothetical protein
MSKRMKSILEILAIAAYTLLIVAGFLAYIGLAAASDVARSYLH